MVVAEQNRAWILRVRSGSLARFFVIPNRPLDDMVADGQSQQVARAVFLRYGGSPSCTKFLIYQGCFDRSRCLDSVIGAFKRLPGPDVGLLLMGADPSEPLCRSLMLSCQTDSRIAFVPRLPPPTHLGVAPGCVAGILLYAPTALNNIYCAPNKLYEYAAAGLGMILPNYPGIEALNREYRIGCVCDPTDADSILAAMRGVLLRPRSEWREASGDFLLRSVCPRELYTEVLDELRARIKSKRPAPEVQAAACGEGAQDQPLCHPKK